MKLSDLKTGMYVTLRNGQMFVVLLKVWVNGDIKDVIVASNGEYISLNVYDENLQHCGCHNDDIVRVYENVYVGDVLDFEHGKFCMWEEEPVKEMTIEEVSAALGYKI